jgi:hypothetical protein
MAAAGVVRTAAVAAHTAAVKPQPTKQFFTKKSPLKPDGLWLFFPHNLRRRNRNSISFFGLYRTAAPVLTWVIPIWKLRRIPDMHHAATGC